MNPIATSASALTGAFTRYERASVKLIDAVSGASNDDPAQAVAEQISAKHQAQASIGVIRIADEMFKALIDISRERGRY